MNARFAICLILLAVAVGDARAQEGGSGTVGELIGKFFEGLDMRRPPPRPADFVAHSRTGETGYTPFAAPTPASDVKTDVKKSAARAAALEKSSAPLRPPIAPAAPASKFPTRRKNGAPRRNGPSSFERVSRHNRPPASKKGAGGAFNGYRRCRTSIASSVFPLMSSSRSIG